MKRSTVLCFRCWIGYCHDSCAGTEIENDEKTVDKAKQKYLVIAATLVRMTITVTYHFNNNTISPQSRMTKL